MKKKGFKLSLRIFAIFLALCAITLYIPHNVLTISAEPLDETANAAMKTDNINETETETDTAWGYVENETEYVDSDDESQSGIGFIGGMEEIQPPDETAAGIQVAPDITTIIKDDGGGYYLEDGIYAFQNKGATKLARWLGVEQGELIPGYGMQATLANGLPSVTFDRPFLFKITRNSTSNTYIIRSMLNNRLSFGFSGYDVLTKEIPADDDDVRVFDTFEITFDIANNCILIKPHGANGDAVTLNENEAYLQRSHVDISGNYSKWIVYKYDGAMQSGVNPIFTPSTTSGSLIKGKTYSIKLVTWTTEIGKNTPYAMIHPDTPGMATATWNESTCILTLTTENSGPFKIRSIIRTDGTTTAFRTYYGNYPIVPDIVGETTQVENVGTGKYIDIEGPSTAESKPIQQWAYNGKNQFKWIFELKSNGYFAIKSKYSSKYIGVDSTDTTKVRQYGTQSDYTLWRIVSTTAGNYKLVCKALESSGLVLAVPLNANANGTDLTMITYTDDTNYRDEWTCYKVYYSATVNHYYDKGYYVRYGETASDSISRIKEYSSAVAERYMQLLGLAIITNNVQYYQSVIDDCKQTVTSANIDITCSHLIDHTNMDTIEFNFALSHPGNSTTTNILWTGHKVYETIYGIDEYNRSYSIGTHVYMLNLCSAADRTLYSQGILMHELAHQFGARDHYHEKDSNGNCVNNDICSDCKTNPRPKSCIMYQSRVDINAGTIFCDECKNEIIEHLNSHHK